MPNFTQYKLDTTRTPSTIIWADCPVNVIQDDPGYGFHFYDDFLWWPNVTATASFVPYPYYTEGDTGVTFNRVADTDFGQMQIAGNDALNDGSVVCYGAQSGFARFGINGTDDVWFEARIKQTTVANGDLSTFIGLAETNVLPTANLTLDDTGEIPDATEDFVGWWVDGATDGDAILPIYLIGGGTRTNVNTISKAIVANTFYKVGMRYKGQTKELFYYFNGALATTLNVGALTSTTFPMTNHLCMCWATKTPNTAEVTTNIDWWRVAAVGGNT